MTTVVGHFPEGTWDAKYLNPKTPHDIKYYQTCQIGGLFSCGLTHLVVSPLELVKCRMQLKPQEYTNLRQGMKQVVITEGSKGIIRGWVPSFVGYSLQGLCKFGLYEIFKDGFMNTAGEDNSANYNRLIWLSAAGCAEFVASVALCPIEKIKFRMQTSPHGTFPSKICPAWWNLVAYRSKNKFPLGGLVPLWCRQIPYTMVQFLVFEASVDTFYNNFLTSQRDSYSRFQQLSVSFASGYIAGVMCAIISQPADVLNSLQSREININKGLLDIIKETDLKTLLTRGLISRISMISALTAFQWLLYDSIKTLSGFETSGGNKVIARTQEQRDRNEIISW